MSQIVLTTAERSEALQRFGYNEREASFLCLAALHSGYFLRRQYGEFLGRQDGGSITQLIEKTLDAGHVRVATYRANTHIYHLAARPFYAALGQEDNRNRRPKEPSTIKAKLMALDFVLRSPDGSYLATEQEKVDYFSSALQLEKSALPAKRYASGGRITERYFVEKYPIFLHPSAQSAAPPVVSFCFIDEGSAGISGFTTFLDRYGNLLRRLRESCLLYVAATSTHFEAAEKVFGSFCGGGREQSGPDPTALLTDRMLEHFEARQFYETERWETFDRAKLIRLRDERAWFSGPENQALYELWKREGRAAVAQILERKDRRSGAICGSVSCRFSTVLLEHSYDLFGNLTTY